MAQKQRQPIGGKGGVHMLMGGISKLDLKRQNRRQILKLLCGRGPMSRVDIAREIQITKAAVTIITNEMIGQGILREKGEQLPKGKKAPRGRKKILLDINPTYRVGMGVVIASSTLYIGLCTLQGEMIERQARPLETNAGLDTILGQVQELYHTLLYKNSLKPSEIAALGICVSPEEYARMEITSPLDGPVDFTRLTERVQQLVKIPVVCGALIDGVAIAELDYRFSQTDTPRNIAVLRYGKGFSCALTVDQELYRGKRGKSAELAGFAVDPDGSACGEVLDAKQLQAQFLQLYGATNMPMLFAQSDGDESRALTLMEDPQFVMQDECLRKFYETLIGCYERLIQQIETLFDPDQMILFAKEDGFGCLPQILLPALEKRFTGCPAGWLRFSGVHEQNLFLAAAALGTRQFFIDQGGL